MNIEDLKKVNVLEEIRSNCIAQLDNAKYYIDDFNREVDNEEDPKPFPFNGDYHGKFSQYVDESGWSIDLSGCYVGNIVATSIIGILVDHIQSLTRELEKYGVEF